MLPGCRARCFHRWCWRHSTNSTSAVIAATKELAEAVPVDRGAMVLDVGSGLGGPSRYLAATYGCHVTGIDLNSSFVEAARYLAERAGFVDQVAYECAEALALPYDNGRFDVAWTQHVAMNIQDRTRLYALWRGLLGAARRRTFCHLRCCRRLWGRSAFSGAMGSWSRHELFSYSQGNAGGARTDRLSCRRLLDRPD